MARTCGRCTGTYDGPVCPACAAIVPLLSTPRPASGRPRIPVPRTEPVLGPAVPAGPPATGTALPPPLGAQPSTPRRPHPAVLLGLLAVAIAVVAIITLLGR